MTATISPRSDVQDVQYDAFLSYSHAADGQLAPALQNAVQRFATPWYRLRSLHLFRDQTGLSASPGLWAAIEAALSRAAWFVLFASPDAAASVWVEREVMWWLAHRDHRQLLIVVTDGTFEWDDANGDSSSRARGSAIPEALAEALPEEPRWIDLRWARSTDHVDPRDPRFGEAAADLAATLRGVPKDSLIGDDVRQHRRGRRLAIGTITVLTLLALVVFTLAVVAARRQAETQGARAARAASSMIVEADAVRSRDPRTALQLGVAAHRLDESPQTEAALVQSLTTPFLAELAGHKTAIRDIAWTRDGTRFATADGDGRVIIHELVDRNSARPLGLPVELGAPAEHLTFTSDGTRLAMTAAGRVEVVELSDKRRTSSAAIPGPTDLLATTPSGDLIIVIDQQMLRWDPAGKMTTELLVGAGGVTTAAMSPDGRLLATASRSSGVVLWDINGPPRRLGIVTSTASEGTLLVFQPRQRLLVGSADGTVAQSDIKDPRAPGQLRPPTRVVERTLLKLDVSSDGRAQAAASIDGSITLTTSSETLKLRAHHTAPVALAFSPDGTRLVSGALDGALILWDTGPGRGPILATLDPDSHDGALLTMAVPSTKDAPLATGGNDGVLLWDVPEPGQLARRPGRIDVPGAALALAFGADDRMLAVGTTTGRVSIWDLSDPGGPRERREIAVPGSKVFDVEFFHDGQTLVAAGEDVGVQLIDVATGTVTALPNPGRPRAVVVTPDARHLIVSDTVTNDFVLWDVSDRERPMVAARIANGHETASVEAMALTPNGTLLVSAGREGKLVLTALEGPDHARELGEIETARRVQTRADSAALLTLTISQDGRILAAAGEEGPIGLWDIADPSRPRQIGAPLVELRGQVYGVGVLSDGLTLVAGGQDERIAAWNLWPIHELRRTAIATACRRSQGPLAADTWARLAPKLEYRDTCIN